MGKVKLLLDVIADIRSLADSLEAVAEAMSCSDSPRTEPDEPKTAAPEPEVPSPAQKSIGKEELRALLGEKSLAGHREAIQALIRKYGGQKFSDTIPPCGRTRRSCRMPPEKHAKLSASSAHRWMNCTPSANLERAFADRPSEAAEEGSAAHALAEHKLRKALKMRSTRPVSKYDSDEMEMYTDSYVEFVLEQIEAARQCCADPLVLIEQRLDFSCYVPDGFGTGDCLIVADKTLHIIDFKYGLGLLVDAAENPQMMLYALGALRLFAALYDIDTVAMSIFQPRRENVSTWTISVAELDEWAKKVLRPKAELAFKGEGAFHPGSWCTFCKAAVKCRARAEGKLALARYEFAPPPLLTDAEIEDILSRLDDLTRWANEITAYAQDAAVNHGKQWNGFKLVEGRTNRKYTNEDAVVTAARAAGYTDIFKKSLIPITEMEKLMGKKAFAEVLGGLVIKPKGKPALVPASDRRPAITTTGAKQDFTDYKGEL